MAAPLHRLIIQLKSKFTTTKQLYSPVILNVNNFNNCQVPCVARVCTSHQLFAGGGAAHPVVTPTPTNITSPLDPMTSSEDPITSSCEPPTGSTLDLTQAIENILKENRSQNPSEVYTQLVRQGILQEDTYQKIQLTHFDILCEKLKNHIDKPQTSLFNKIYTWKWNAKRKKIKGLYLHGSVGCGKTLLMDMFFKTVNVDKKVRTHFHSFMLDVHSRIHTLKKSMPNSVPGKRMKPFDPISQVARNISSETWLMCFDEFQVTDVADAMILKGLFTEMFKNGVVVVATSNRKPDNLYKNGLQRSNFLPFIDVLKKYCHSPSLDSGIDYRTQLSRPHENAYFITDPANSDADHELDVIFDEIAGQSGEAVMPRELELKGRILLVPASCGKLADFTFDYLCKRPLGAADYLAIANTYDTVIVRNIPKMTLANKTEARRFITMIDTFYDKKVWLICSAEMRIKNLFEVSELSQKHLDDNRKLLDDLNLSDKCDAATASVFTGEDELFAFQRTISRLTEMQSEAYWQSGQKIS